MPNSRAPPSARKAPLPDRYTLRPELLLRERLRSLVMKTALVIVGLLVILGVTVGWAIWGWQQTAGTAMGFHGWLAMILGIVFTIVIGCGLMGLMFYSSRYGYDERASDLSDKDEK